jgi:prenyltransferase beta subunit
MSGVYWALTALALLPGCPIARFMSENDIVAWISNCKKPDGSYSHNVHHDGCLLATLSAVQILVLLRREDEVDADAVASCTSQLSTILCTDSVHDFRHCCAAVTLLLKLSEQNSYLLIKSVYEVQLHWSA